MACTRGRPVDDDHARRGRDAGPHAHRRRPGWRRRRLPAPRGALPRPARSDLARYGEPRPRADLAQDAIDAAYDEIADLRDPEGFYPWLRRIAINRLLKDIRQRGRRQAALDRLRPHLPRVADPLVRVLIRETAAELSRAHRTVLVLHDDLGYSIPEIAVHLGISEDATWKRLTRAREEFQRRYAEK